MKIVRTEINIPSVIDIVISSRRMFIDYNIN